MPPQNAEAARVTEVVAGFSHATRPFAWWLMPGDRPDDLASILSATGLQPADSELAMAADFAALRPIGEEPPGLQIERVRRLPQLQDFAAVVAGGWTPNRSGLIGFRLIGPDVDRDGRGEVRFHVIP